MLNSILDPSAASFTCYDRTGSSDSKIVRVVELEDAMERPATSDTSTQQENELWSYEEDLRVWNFAGPTYVYDPYRSAESAQADRRIAVI